MPDSRMSPAPVVGIDHPQAIGSSNTYSALPQAGKTHPSVQQTEQYPQHHARSPSTQARKFWDKLGWYNIAVLVFGTIATLLAIAFLGLLWSGSHSAIRGGNPSSLWYRIVERAWAARVVTVCTVAIRIAITAQMGVFTALLAALVLERVGVPGSQLPILSIIRSVNTGPQVHWSNILSIHTPSQFCYAAAVVLAVLNSFALQFTSTILLSDFRPGNIVLHANSSYVAYGFPASSNWSSTYFTSGVDHFKNSPTTYARFAEYTAPRYEAVNYTDTGRTLRAYLPLNSLEQRSLRNYSGPATVIDTRVICIAPSIDITFLDLGGDGLLTVQANITTQGSYPALSFNTSLDTTEPISIVCGVDVDSGSSSYWSLSLCALDIVVGAKFSENIQDGSPVPNTPYGWLILNTTGSFDSWLSAFGDEGGTLDNRGGVIESQNSSGPWMNMLPSDGSSSFGMDASLCFSDLSSSDYEVEVGSDRDYTEPVLQWHPSSGTYLTEDVRRELGATSKEWSLSARSIPSLRPSTGEWATSGVKNTTMQFLSSVVDWIVGSNFVLTDLSKSSEGIAAAPTLMMNHNIQQFAVHRTHAAIFQDIIQDTLNPALALQALLTTVTQMAYYDFFPQFDSISPSTHTNTSTVIIPVQWIGFIVIMALLGIHYVLVFAATILFFAKTEHSLLGNAWQAFAQVVSKDVDHTMQQAANLTDNEVEKLLKKSGNDKTEFVLQTGMDDGRTQAVNRRRTGGVVELQLLNRNSDLADKI